MNDTEILSDDDVAVVDQIIDLDKIDNARSYKGKSKIETIVIDDETLSQSDKNNETNNGKNMSSLDIDSIYKENQLLAEFIEKCLNLEHSEGMLRVIKRSLLRVYEETEKKYKRSPEFENLLRKQINFIEAEPHKKFTHMRNIIDALKSDGVKKRVKLTTLATNLKKNNNTTLVQRNKQNKRVADFGERKVKRSKNNEIIDLDSDPNDVIPVINLDEDQNDVILLDDPARIEEEKENNRDINKIDNMYVHKNSQNDSEENSFLTPQIEVFVSNNLTEQQCINTEPVERQIDHNGQLDEPMTDENTVTEEEHRNVETQIKKLENQIEKCKQIAQQLDEAEVTNDNTTSPYILSEKVKAKIVSLYKELCDLTGSESTKKRTVRLQVQDGHPAGPVKRLEEFINNNIREDGDPLFPDFRDVTVCVLEASEADGLGWSKGQILKEASALFTQCGRALQRRRQKREWRDLLATVKSESLEYDPADDDAILESKLQQNRRIALRKEQELLDRYSRMQDMPAQAKLNKSNALPVTQNGIRIIDRCENINVRNEANYVANDITVQNKANNMINHMNVRSEPNITMEFPSGSKENHEYIATNKELNPLNNSGVWNTLNPHVIIKTEVSVEFEHPENDVQVPENSKKSLSVDVKNTDDIPCSQRISTKEDVTFEHNTNESNVQIKNEPLYLEDTNSSDHVPCGQRLQMEDDRPFENDTREPNVQVENSNENYLYCVDNSPSCQLQLAGSSSENVNVDREKTNNSNKTVNTTEEHSQEDIPKKKHYTNMRNGSCNSLVNEEANHYDKAVTIKKEPVDVAALLDALGDDFSADIVDIEDPFLVIEISDSSDEE